MVLVSKPAYNVLDIFVFLNVSDDAIDCIPCRQFMICGSDYPLASGTNFHCLLNEIKWLGRVCRDL